MWSSIPVPGLVLDVTGSADRPTTVCAIDTVGAVGGLLAVVANCRAGIHGMRRAELSLIACSSSVQSANRTTRQERSHVEEPKCVCSLTNAVESSSGCTIGKASSQCLKRGVTFARGAEGG